MSLHDANRLLICHSYLDQGRSVNIIRLNNYVCSGYTYAINARDVNSLSRVMVGWVALWWCYERRSLLCGRIIPFARLNRGAGNRFRKVDFQNYSHE
jgi:hypothetical protein